MKQGKYSLDYLVCVCLKLHCVVCSMFEQLESGGRGGGRGGAIEMGLVATRKDEHANIFIHNNFLTGELEAGRKTFTTTSVALYPVQHKKSSANPLSAQGGRGLCIAGI